MRSMLSVSAMHLSLLLSSIDRAGDHAVILAIVVGVAAVGYLIYRMATRGR